MPQDEKRDEIRRLNDLFRRSLSGGKLVITAGVQNLGRDALPGIVRAVQVFCNFDNRNDPFSEHDFGRIDISGHELFWKIDYYDPTLTFGSSNPSDPRQTIRVLTIMLAEEY